MEDDERRCIDLGSALFKRTRELTDGSPVPVEDRSITDHPHVVRIAPPDCQQPGRDSALHGCPRATGPARDRAELAHGPGIPGRIAPDSIEVDSLWNGIRPRAGWQARTRIGPRRARMAATHEEEDDNRGPCSNGRLVSTGLQCHSTPGRLPPTL